MDRDEAIRFLYGNGFTIGDALAAVKRLEKKATDDDMAQERFEFREDNFAPASELACYRDGGEFKFAVRDARE